ncbi:MAG: hypothetical protein FWD58_09475 [Firmicutes bacterium]|nr:hypothetical protein [Bacillota bacterium]
MRVRNQNPAVTFVLLCAFFCALFCVAVFSNTALGARAEEEQSGVLYRYFDGASTIFASEGSVYIADSSAVHVYSPAAHKFNEENLAIGNVMSMAAANGRLYTVAGSAGNLFATALSDGARFDPDFNPDSLPAAPAPATGYSHLAALPDAVFASSGRDIHIFDTNLSYLRTARAPDEILGFSAGSGGVVYAAVRDGNSRFAVYALTKNASGAFPASLFLIGERFAGLAYLSSENVIAAVGRNKVHFYDADSLTFKNDPARTDRGALFVAGADCFYSINDDDSFSRISADFKTETLLAQASGSTPGFYNTPVDIASRQGKIFTADRLNHRVSVQTGSGFSALDGLRETLSVACDADGNLYAAYNARYIQTFDPSGIPANPDEPYQFAPEASASKTIKLLRADSKGNLYVIDGDNFLYKRAAGAQNFEPAYLNTDGTPAKVYGMSAGLNNSEFYIAVRKSAADEHPKQILRRSANKTADGKDIFEPTGITDIAGFYDFAADEDNGIYIMQEISGAYKIIRYDCRTVAGVANLADGGAVFSYTLNAASQNLPGASSPASVPRIHLSAIENDQIGYRDILYCDPDRHTVKSVACSAFGIHPDIPKTPPTLPSPAPLPAPGAAATEKLIRLVQNADGAQLFCGPNDIYPVTRYVNAAKTIPENVRLPNNYRVIVPGFNPAAEYSLVIADNIAYEAFGDYDILTGYVRTKYLSAPLAYTDDHPARCMANYDAGTKIYSYPSVQAPIYEGFDKVDKGTVFALLDFVLDGAPNYWYGYYDNRSLAYEHSVRWYRVALQPSGVVGFVDADSVTVNGLPSLTSVQLKTNAVIVSPAGAPVYVLEGAEYVLDTLQLPLKEGKRIKVDTPFDPSAEFTRISFTTEFGVVENRYVKTEYIKYDGPNILLIVVVCAIILIALLTVIIIARYLSSKRRRPLVRAKEPEE